MVHDHASYLLAVSSFIFAVLITGWFSKLCAVDRGWRLTYIWIPSHVFGLKVLYLKILWYTWIKNGPDNDRYTLNDFNILYLHNIRNKNQLGKTENIVRGRLHKYLHKYWQIKRVRKELSPVNQPFYWVRIKVPGDLATDIKRKWDVRKSEEGRSFIKTQGSGWHRIRLISFKRRTSLLDPTEVLHHPS